MNYNQMLFQPAGALDPYGNQGGEFQQSRDYGKPQRQEEPMLDPQRMAWAQAVSNIGSIWADQGMSNSVGGAYAQAKAQNDKFRNNKAALARQAEQDEQQKRLFDMQIAESNKPTVVKVGKNTYMNQYPDGRLEEINGIGINDAPFEGTGMEAQTLNILFDPSIPDNDPRKIAARQRLRRPTTVTTAEGTFVRDGYNLDKIFPSSPTAENIPQLSATGAKNDLGDFTPKKPTEGERKAAYSSESMTNIGKRLVDANYIPPLDEYAASQTGVVGSFYTSPEFKDWKRNTDEWARNLVFLRSGATARQEEVDAAVQNYWPQPGDEPDDVKRKVAARKDAEEQARKMGGRAVDNKTPSTDGDIRSLSDEDLFK